MAAEGFWRKLKRQRISRRAWMRSVGIGTAGLVALGATGGATSLLHRNARPAVAGAALHGGTLRQAVAFDWGTIDPLTSVAFGPQLFPSIYNSLVSRSTRQLDFVYFDLAQSFEQPDEETYLFNIRPGVMIAPNSLGVPERDMDSGDVQAWFDRIAADDSAVMRSFTNLWLDSTSAPDPSTFELKTAGPYAYTLFRIGNPLGGTIPPREFFERGIRITDQGVGAGPWAVIEPGSYFERGGIVVRRNPNYYRRAANGDALPYIDKVEYIRIVDRQPRRAAFLDRQIDSYGAQDREEADGLLTQIPDLKVVEDPVNTFISFTMNPTRAPWDDERIRKAALHALNRQQFVDLIVGEGGGRPNGLVHWPLGEFALPPEELDELQSYDPALSRALILEATGSDSIEIKVSYPVTNIEFHDKHLPIFLQQMSDAGFNIQEEPQDFSTWLGSYTTVDYDASLALNQIYDTAEIPLDFHAAQGPQGDGNFAIGIGTLFPEIDEAIQQSKRVTDLAIQAEQVREVQRELYARGPAFLPIMSWTAFTMYQPFVKNILQGLGTTGLFQASEWWLGPDAPERPDGLLGDVNCDDRVNAVDAALILQRDAGLVSTLPCDENADVSGDGRINSIDAALILQREAGLLR